jgi:5'-nucleotidase / UDP-sugar diphosphatase
MTVRKTALILGLAAFALAAHAQGFAKQAPVRLTILHTNDHHGHFWRNEAGEYGLAARKTLVDRIRADVKAQGGHVLLLDAGDVNTGIPESDQLEGEPDFRGMSLMGYDAMAVGNHEFDKSPAALEQQHRKWSSFPWLSANIYKGDARAFEPYRIFHFGTLRVAVLGLTTDDTAKLVDRKKFPDLAFRSPIDEARRMVPELRKQADVVIAATHMGHYVDGRRGVNGPGDVELARSVAGIDLIVGGHSHTALCMKSENVRIESYEPGSGCLPDFQNGAWILQAGDLGRYVGRADGEYRDGKFRLMQYSLLPVNLRKSGAAEGARIAEDPAMLALLAPFQQKAAAGLSAAVATTEGLFEGARPLVRARQTNLGMLITAAMVDKTKADVGLISSGGVRDSLPVGPVSYRDILKVQPFGNHIYVVTLTGAELMEYLQFAATRTPGSGALPQFYGARLVVDQGRLAQVEIAGKPVDLAATYRLAVNSFVAKGGDGYPDLSVHPSAVNTGYVDAEVLREYALSLKVLRAGAFDPSGMLVRK